MILLVSKDLMLFVIGHIYVYFGRYETHKHNCDSFEVSQRRYLHAYENCFIGGRDRAAK